jgi:hypothetical protein
MNQPAASNPGQGQGQGENAAAAPAGRRRLLRRGPWENASAGVIGLGILMLTQPIALVLYTYSFVVILGGTIAFLITSHFPE